MKTPASFCNDLLNIHHQIWAACPQQPTEKLQWLASVPDDVFLEILSIGKAKALASQDFSHLNNALCSCAALLHAKLRLTQQSPSLPVALIFLCANEGGLLLDLLQDFPPLTQAMQCVFLLLAHQPLPQFETNDAVTQYLIALDRKDFPLLSRLLHTLANDQELSIALHGLYHLAQNVLTTQEFYKVKLPDSRCFSRDYVKFSDQNNYAAGAPYVLFTDEISDLNTIYSARHTLLIDQQKHAERGAAHFDRILIPQNTVLERGYNYNNWYSLSNQERKKLHLSPVMPFWEFVQLNAQTFLWYEKNKLKKMIAYTFAQQDDTGFRYYPAQGEPRVCEYLECDFHLSTKYRKRIQSLKISERECPITYLNLLGRELRRVNIRFGVEHPAVDVVDFPASCCCHIDIPASVQSLWQLNKWLPKALRGKLPFAEFDAKLFLPEAQE